LRQDLKRHFADVSLEQAHVVHAATSAAELDHSFNFQNSVILPNGRGWSDLSAGYQLSNED
jgi:hypothetical protein